MLYVFFQDRIKLGCNNLYLFLGHPSLRSPDQNPELFDYNYFQTELADGAGFGQRGLVLPDSSFVAGSDWDLTSSIVFQEYIKLLPLINEANAMSSDMKKVR